jgi:uncharacterized protein YukJ
MNQFQKAYNRLSMPIPNYSVLKGDPQPGKVTGLHPHFRIPVQTDAGAFTVDVNVQSFDKSEVLYAIIQNFTPPDASSLLTLPNGVTQIASQPGGLALDYLRGSVGGVPMITQSAMTLLPIGNGNDLNDQVAAVVNQAIEDEGGIVYAFGSSFADAGGASGIHDVHMNQGNPLNSHAQDNGIWQDGALFVYLPSQNQWIAVFIAFQTETWDTDDAGNPAGSSLTTSA